MADYKAFLKIKREVAQYRPVCERIKDYKYVGSLRSDTKSAEQGSRCMDCGTPFCHWGCPIGNYIPEWNTLMSQGHWKEALNLLHATNNFPEITGRVCPALCEYSCVLGINDDPVTIRENELAIIEYGFSHGFIKPFKVKKRTGKKIAIIGSGPAGLACADQLNRAGHNVTIFEKDDSPGGILRYGIPDFKLEKRVLDRRIDILREEGVKFSLNTEVGINYSISKLKRGFDAVCLTIGSRVPRDLKIEGRGLKGIYFAMDYLIQANKLARGMKIGASDLIDARDKNVVVIGGGDTGADCIGTAHRQGARCLVQIELLPKPSGCRTGDFPWPSYPLMLKTSSSHEEGGERHWSILTKKIIGENGHAKKLSCVKIEFPKNAENTCPVIKEIPGSEFEIAADLILLAIGFLYPQHTGLVKKLHIEVDKRGNIKTDPKYKTSAKNIFAAGDANRGQSLVVWAFYEGRQAARCIDEHLMGSTRLPLI